MNRLLIPVDGSPGCERAVKHGITLDIDVDDRLGEYLGDERKIKQILLNLLSNRNQLFASLYQQISLARQFEIVECSFTESREPVLMIRWHRSRQDQGNAVIRLLQHLCEFTDT